MTQFTHTEKEAIRTMLHHAWVDMEYGAGGSYVNIEQDNEVDKKEQKKGIKGLALIYELLEQMDNHQS